MVQIYILLLTLGTLYCGPLTVGQEESSHLQAAAENLDTIVEGEVEDKKNGEEGIHLHAAAGDLNNFINVIQNKHPKDVRLGDEEEVNGDSSKVEVEVEVKKSTGVVEEQFLENMKNYNNLKDALTSLSSDIDKVASDRSQEEKCDNSVSDSSQCKEAPAKKELESSGWIKTMLGYIG